MTWWQRYVLWDVYAVVVTALTGSIVAVSHGHSAAVRSAAVALLAGLVAWYVAWGRSLMRAEVVNWRGYVYVAGAAALFLPAVALVNGSSFALWVLCPHAYMVLPLTHATITVIGYNAAYLAVVAARAGDPAFILDGPLQAAAVAIVGSIVFGTWATGVSQQNDERALLIQELERTRAQVARLSHEAGVIAERGRLAGEIHDTIAQDLSSMIMLMQVAEAEVADAPEQARERLALAISTARESLGEARALVGALTPAALDGASLRDALLRLVERFQAETGVAASLTSEGEPRPPHTGVDVVILRAAQEALANVRKHAGARRVDVLLCHRRGATVLTVADDGRGFDKDQVSGGYGLPAMASRVRQASGSLAVDSVPGRGTTVRVEVPTP